MRKVKIFKSVEDELSGLEMEINAWVENSKSHIISVTGNIAPQSSGNSVDGTFSSSDVLVIVVYEEANV